jgi:uncharacterized membrane protein
MEVNMDQNNAHVMQNSTRGAPKVGACYKNGWRQLWKYFLELLLISIIAFLFMLPQGLFDVAEETGGAPAVLLGILALAYTVLVFWPIDYGVAFAHLKAARGDQLKVKDMFAAFRNYLNAILANILVAAIFVIGLALLIVPGIIFGCKLAFTPYLIVDRKLDAIEAVKESWRMTKGYAWKVFFIGLLAIPIGIAGLLCFGVGIIVAVMWIRLAFASLYNAVSRPAETPIQAAEAPE